MWLVLVYREGSTRLAIEVYISYIQAYNYNLVSVIIYFI